jgi:hypothetical protein
LHLAHGLYSLVSWWSDHLAADVRGQDVDQAEREALTILCQELPTLRVDCAKFSERHVRLLARVEEEAAARRPVLDLLAELLGGTRNEVLEEHRSAATGLPGTGGGRADDEVFGCPDDACGHQTRTVPAGTPPRCSLTRREMKRL